MNVAARPHPILRILGISYHGTTGIFEFSSRKRKLKRVTRVALRLVITEQNRKQPILGQHKLVPT